MHSPTLNQRLAEQRPPNASVVMKQTWSDLLFLHWEYDPCALQHTLPDGLYVDTFQGHSYLGVVPFRMEKIRPTGLPPVPGLSWFNELNLRTYVHDKDGRPGVWFYTLDCNQPIAVELAKALFHLPYNHAKMSLRRNGNKRTFSSKRAGQEHSLTFEYSEAFPSQPYQRAAPGTLEFFLAERYLLYSQNKEGTLHVGQVHHAPYELQQASLSQYTSNLFELEGFLSPHTPPVSKLIARPVEVSVFPLNPVTSPSSY